MEAERVVAGTFSQMPDEPLSGKIGPDDDPEAELRKAFEEAERELASQGHHLEEPVSPLDEDLKLHASASPVEGFLNDDEGQPKEPHALDPEEEQIRILEERLRAATAKHQGRKGSIDEEFAGRMDEFDDRYGPTLEKRKAQKEDEARRAKSEASASKGLGLGLSIAYTILGLPLVGIGIGWFLDKELHTNVWKGILATIGACAGVAFTVMMMNRLENK